MNDEAARAIGPERAPEQLFLHRGFTPINSSPPSSIQQTKQPPPRPENSTRKKANATVKRASEIRETILESSLILTQTDPEWFQGDSRFPSANSKKKRTVSQDLIQSGSNDAFTSLKRVKSRSSCFPFDSHATISSTSNRSPSRCSPLNTSKDDALVGLSILTINNLHSFIYQPIEPRASLITQESSGGIASGENGSSISRFNAPEVGSEFPIESCQNALNLNARAQNPENLPEKSLRPVPSHLPDQEEVNGLHRGSDHSEAITSDLNSEVWSDLPDPVFSDDPIPTRHVSNISEPVDSQDGQFIEVVDDDPHGVQEEDFGHIQRADDFETVCDDYSYNTCSEDAPGSTERDFPRNAYSAPSLDASKVSQEGDEFEVESDDDEFLALYESFHEPVDEDVAISTVAFLQQPPDSYIRADEWIADDGIDDEDWNALYDVNSASTPGLPKSHGVLEGLEAMDAVGNDSGHLLPPIEYPEAGHSDPAKCFEINEYDVDEEIDEECLLQAEAQLLESEDHELPEDEFDFDQSVLLQDEGYMLAVMPEELRVGKAWSLPPSTPKSSRGRNGIPSPTSLQRLPSVCRVRQEQIHDEPKDPTPPSPVSMITLSSTTSPSRKASSSSSHSTQEIFPFVRPPFPKAVTNRCPIYGVSNKSMLRVCFRIAEVFKAASSQRSSDTTVTIEFYAAVTHSSRCADIQTFNFADLFFPSRPPFLTGSCDGWKGSQLYEHDMGAFLDASPTRLRMCRAIGTLTRTISGQLDVKILNIWEASWEDVSWVRGIVSP